MRVLVVNSGSSSVKLRLLDGADEVVAHRNLGPVGGSGDGELERALTELGRSGVDAVGHRVVHGGTRYHDAVLIDAGVRRHLTELIDLAPLHQPAALAGMDEVSRLLPDTPAVACFDTAFHATMPAAAATYALPADWRNRFGLRRYGFHGLSHAYAAHRAAALVDRPVPGLRLVSAHLGAGASLCAIRDGRSVDTTMGFTPLDGLVMASRSGSVDPGLLVWLEQTGGLSAQEIDDGLEHRSGLQGLAGTTDMREVVARAAAGDEAAELAFDVYAHRLRASIAAMAASLGGLDVLAYTAGVGENSPAVRAAGVAGMAFLGLAVNPGQNEAARGDADISAAGAPAKVVVLTAREDLEIAAAVRRIVGAGAPASRAPG